MKACNVCLGTGHVWNWTDEDMTEEACEFCGGTGHIPLGGQNVDVSHGRENGS